MDAGEPCAVAAALEHDFDAVGLKQASPAFGQPQIR